MEYQALQLVSSLEHYGVEWHWARDANSQRLAIGVGPEGIAICKEDFALVNRYVPTAAMVVFHSRNRDGFVQEGRLSLFDHVLA